MKASLLVPLAFAFSLCLDWNWRARAEAREHALTQRVALVRPANPQPQAHAPAVIFQDDFQKAPAVPPWFEYDSSKGSFVWSAHDGLDAGSGAMRCQFEKGQVSAGSLKVVFGKNPFHRGARQSETFNEIYWRVYVRHERGWEGNPAKLARATCLAANDWSQGFIAHVWGGKGEALCIDPATGIQDNEKVTTRYNDFQHLHWLGSRESQTPIFSPAESGRWVCVESHIRLNTPGMADGLFKLWVDGKLEASRTNLNWQGTWHDYAIDAVFLENYWNQGSLKRQARWFDNFVISTAPIGPITATDPPVLTPTAIPGGKPWEVEAAEDPEGRDIVWQSAVTSGSTAELSVDAAHGKFAGSRSGSNSLKAGTEHWLRVRFAGEKEWSPWHSPFKT